MGVREGGKINYIPEKSNILSDEPTGNTTRLVFFDNAMNDLEKPARDGSSSDLVINIEQRDGAPIPNIESITLFKRKRDNPSALRT